MRPRSTLRRDRGGDRGIRSGALRGGACNLSEGRQRKSDVHREVYATLRDVLVREAPEKFIFVDIACGAATASAEALAGTQIGRYIGIDISSQSLKVAEEALKQVGCPVELRCEDFVQALEGWTEPADVVWIGMSLHHLRAPEKLTFMRSVSRILGQDGLFLIWEPTCLDDEDRAGWLRRFLTFRRAWGALSDEQFSAFEVHMEAADFPETAQGWAQLGHRSGFARVDELYAMANLMGRVFQYRH